MGFKLIRHKNETQLSCFKKIGKYNVDDLAEYTYLFLHDRLNNKELNNLKYLKDSNELILEDDAIFGYKEIIQKLEYLGKTNKISLSINDKQTFDKFILNQTIPDYKNIVVEDNLLKEHSLKNYIYFESLLYKIVEPAKNLSPFEKYIFAYNIVKKFKEYNESERSFLSRNLYHILINEYAVCVGFCEFLKDLLSKLNIYSTEYAITGKDLKNNSSWGHMRLYVNIKDDKYGINGFYISDPTWDNDLEVDYYNHLMLTNKEANLECDFNISALNKECEVFECSSLDDLYLKIDNIIKEENFYDLLKKIRNLDLNYYEYLNKKFDVNNPDEKIISDLTRYIYDHINNEVLGSTIMQAVDVIYRHSYGYKEEELEDKLEEVRKINSRRQNCLFPSKIRVDSDTELDIIVLQNKFEKSSNKIFKY